MYAIAVLYAAVFQSLVEGRAVPQDPPSAPPLVLGASPHPWDLEHVTRDRRTDLEPHGASEATASQLGLHRLHLIPADDPANLRQRRDRGGEQPLRALVEGSIGLRPVPMRQHGHRLTSGFAQRQDGGPAHELGSHHDSTGAR